VAYSQKAQPNPFCADIKKNKNDAATPGIQIYISERLAWQHCLSKVPKPGF